MKKVYLLSCVLMTSLLGQSQLLTWSPAFPKDNDNITITVDATKGNQGLLGFSGNVYVHIGLITSASTSSSNCSNPHLTGETHRPQRRRLQRVQTNGSIK